MTKRLRTGANSHTTDTTYVRRVVYCEGPQTAEDKRNHERWHGRTENGAQMVMVDCCSVMSYRPSTPLLRNNIHHVCRGFFLNSSGSMQVGGGRHHMTSSVSSKNVGILNIKKCMLADPLWKEDPIDSNGSTPKLGSANSMFVIICSGR
jgi:hypothetical protein